MERNRKTVVVTGASQGIGAGIAQAFRARGYNVVGPRGTRRNQNSFQLPIISP